MSIHKAENSVSIQTTVRLGFGCVILLPAVCFRALDLREFIFHCILLILFCALFWQNQKENAGQETTSSTHHGRRLALICLFFSYLVLHFDPSRREIGIGIAHVYYTATILVAVPAIGLCSLLALWRNEVVARQFRSHRWLSPSLCALIVTCLVALAYSAVANPLHTTGNFLGTFAVVCLLVIAVYTFGSLFLAGSRFVVTPPKTSLPLGIVGIMGLSVLLGCGDLLLLRRDMGRATSLYETGQAVESARLLRSLEDLNWPNFTLVSQDVYRGILDLLTLEMADPDLATFSIRQIERDIPSSGTDSERLFLADQYFRIGEAYSRSGRSRLAQEAFDQAGSWGDPLRLLVRLDSAYSRTGVEGIWDGPAHVNLQDFESVDEMALRPWDLQRKDRLIAQHRRMTDGHSGGAYEYLRLQYDDASPRSYDYFLFDEPGFDLRTNPPVGVEFLARSNTPGVQVSLFLEITYRTSTGTYSSTLPVSGSVTLTQEWVSVTYDSLHTILDGTTIPGGDVVAAKVTNLGLLTLSQSGDVCVDDLRLFLY
ncbi:MAG: hypothetical protein HOM68_28655 [Gemmatimonadetes bacterium]|nr:hypothetical protein [Gemmatimonadota bacterium]MBT5144019.1 hypothetical protein [Gemmatimonadota bacterium]